MISKTTFLLIVALTVSSAARAADQLPACQGVAIADLGSAGLPLALSELSNIYLLAREAKIYVETSELTLQAKQDFLNPHSQIECFSGSSKAGVKVSLNVPSLLDFSAPKSAGNSVWLFNLIVDAHQIGIWNQFSHLLSNSFKLSDLLTFSANQQILFSQINHDEYELIIKWKSQDQTDAAVIIFDAVQP